MQIEDIIQEIRADVKEIRAHIIELVKQGAVSNQTLIEHERRSTNLEARFEPVERDMYLIRRLSLLFTSSGGIMLILAVAKHLLSK